MTDTLIGGVRTQWTAANAATVLRIVLTVPVVVFAFYEWWGYACIVILLALLTDAEGAWARLTQTTTPLGRVLDPLADKIFFHGALLAVITTTGEALVLLWWVVTFCYDIDNTYRRRIDIATGLRGKNLEQEDVPVTTVSKAKTVMLFVTLGLLYAPKVWLMGFQSEVTTIAVILSLSLVIHAWWQNRKEGILERVAELRRK